MFVCLSSLIWSQWGPSVDPLTSCLLYVRIKVAVTWSCSPISKSDPVAWRHAHTGSDSQEVNEACEVGGFREKLPMRAQDWLIGYELVRATSCQLHEAGADRWWARLWPASTEFVHVWSALTGLTNKVLCYLFGHWVGENVSSFHGLSDVLIFFVVVRMKAYGLLRSYLGCSAGGASLTVKCVFVKPKFSSAWNVPHSGFFLLLSAWKRPGRNHVRSKKIKGETLKAFWRLLFCWAETPFFFCFVLAVVDELFMSRDVLNTRAAPRHTSSSHMFFFITIIIVRENREKINNSWSDSAVLFIKFREGQSSVCYCLTFTCSHFILS